MRKIKQLMCALLSLVLIISMGGFGKTIIVSAADSDVVTIVYNIKDTKYGIVSFVQSYEPGEKLVFPTRYDYEYKYNSEDEGVNLRRYRLGKRWLNKDNEFVSDDITVTEDMNGMVLTAEIYSRSDLKLCYYVLNRGLTQPDEISSYPKPNYSQGIEINDAIRHFTELGDEEAVNDNIIIKPTREQLEEVGVILADNEYVKWYVLKDEADHWHIDGIITEKDPEIEEPTTETETETEEPTTETETETEEVTTETETETEEVTTETETETEEVTTETETETEEVTTEVETETKEVTTEAETETEEVTTEAETETKEVTTEVETETEEVTTETETKKPEVLGTEEVNNKKPGETVVKKPAKKRGVLSTIEIKDHVSRYTKNTKNTGVLSANTTNVVKTSDDKPINQAVAALVISGAAFIIAFRKKVK